MKKFCCVACVVLLMLVVCIPCFAESTTSAPETTAPVPVDWFSGSTQVLTGYRFTVSSPIHSADSPSDWAKLKSWLSAVGAVSVATAVGNFNVRTTTNGDWSNRPIHLEEDQVKMIGYYCSGVISGYYDVPSTAGYNIALEMSNVTVTPVYSTVTTEGFIGTGVNASIVYLGNVLNYIWNTPAIMICIGVAVGVVLVGWGISKVKDLVVGY